MLPALSGNAQRALQGAAKTEQKPSNKKDSSQVKPPITAYKIISIDNDTTFVDTSLTIHKDYKFNYLRKDNFELVPFTNTGQTYNTLSPKLNATNTIPGFGANARHYNFMEAEDINYYRVPTPLTELYFKTVPEQGQQLDALFTINTSDQFNFSIAYKGVRALGRYQHILTNSGNFRTTFNYHTRNNRYRVKVHFVAQDLMNQENGGLSEQALIQYIGEEEEFEDRSLLKVNFEDAESTLYGKRFYLDQDFRISKLDSLSELSIGHTLNFTYKKFQFKQSVAQTEIFGESFETSNLNDEVRLESLYNEAFVDFTNRYLGKVRVKAGANTFNYGYNTVYVLEEDRIENRIKGTNYLVGGEFSKQIGGFELTADASLNLASEFEGNTFAALMSYRTNQNNKFQIGLSHNSSAPDFNFLLFQSDYLNYNWQNDFDNIETQNITAGFFSDKYGKATGNITRVQNFTYFTKNGEGEIKPFQYNDQVSYVKLKVEKGVDFGLFALDNTVMYQKVLDGNTVVNLPELVTRNSFYYKDYWFNKALYLQTGFTLKYFTKYSMNGYDPVLAEFYVQNTEDLGDFPVVDFFFNAKVDQTRIFFKLQHLNALIEQNNNFAAPGYPYGDFLVRFGLVWNFFM